MRSKELGPVAVIKNALRIGAVIGLAGTLVSEREAVQSAFSQVPPSPQGIVEELKGPMPLQQAFQEQVRVLASQGDPLQSGEREQTAEVLKKDIFVSSLALDPSNPDRLYAVAMHFSRGDAKKLYETIYDPVNKKFTWQQVGKIQFPELGIYLEALAVGQNAITVAGRDKDFPNKGIIALITKDGQSVKYLDLPTIGRVLYDTFSKDGKTAYYSGNNLVETAGIVIKVDVASQIRLAVANNGLEQEQAFGGPLLASPNNNETLYAVSGIAPRILRTQDGAQNWEKLISTPAPPYYFNVVNWQGKDVVVAGGTVWTLVQIEGQAPIWDYTQNLATVAVDNTGQELKLFGARYSEDIKVKNLSEADWRDFPTTGLPTDMEVRDLRFLITSDGKKWLVMSVFTPQASYGFWAYDLSQGETSGSWQQMSDGLEWKDPWPFKIYFPLGIKQSSGGW